MRTLQITPDELRDIRNDAKQEALQIAGDTRQPRPRSGRQHSIPRYGAGGYEDHPYDDFGNYRGPTIPNPNPGQGFDWASGPKNNTRVAHRSHKPSFTHDGIPRYGWGDDSHDPNQHRIPVDDYNNPIPSLKPTDLQIDKENNRYIDPSLYDEAGMLLSELNPEQLKILKTIPSDLNKRKPEERLKIMRDIHGKVMEKA